MQECGKRYKILNSSVKVMSGGPDLATVFGEVMVQGNDEIFRIFLAEVDGCPTFCKSSESVMEKLKGRDIYDPSQMDIPFFNDLYENHRLPYEEYEQFFEAEENELTPVLRYLIFLVRCDWDDAKKWKRKSRGKFADKLKIPMTDIEEEWLEEKQYEEDGE